MNPRKQFWSLLKFQAAINPFLFIFPLVFGMPAFIPYFTGSFRSSYHPSLDILLIIQNLVFVGIVGAPILAPDKFQFGASTLSANYYGTEFLITRAVDRSLLYRAKASLLYALILIIPLIALVHSLGSPDLVVRESSKQVQAECLQQIFGSTLLPSEWKKSPPSLISIPQGNLLVSAYQLWAFTVTTIALQLLFILLSPFKYARAAFWILFFGFIFVPTIIEIYSIGDNLSLYEALFFMLSAHPLISWTLTAVALVVVQLWSERRFTQMEQ